ncbi:unnamed protein product [Caenorhabditis bovis]|uniref:Secreted protein n=1 Tax=Caenorhabditis bovis TaxID=2654633 RepID=A0A8S1ES73_9PELO|nr:unnamed protein product [Caenorhabditis bovis]
MQTVTLIALLAVVAVPIFAQFDHLRARRDVVEASGEGSGVESSGVEASGEGSGEAHVDAHVESSGEASGETAVLEGSGEGSGAIIQRFHPIPRMSSL